MGSQTLATIRSTVRLRGDFPISFKFTDAYVNTEIQSAYSEYYELVATTHEGWFDKDQTVPTIAAQPYIALPTDHWRNQAIDILDGGEYRPLRQVGIKDRNRFGAGTSMPVAFRLSARGAELYQPPDAVYTLRVSYTPLVTPLIEDTPVEFLNDWEEYTIEGALLRLYKREERPMQETWTKLYDPENGLKTRITRAASERKSASPELLNLHLYDEFDGYNPGSY